MLFSGLLLSFNLFSEDEDPEVTLEEDDAPSRTPMEP